MDPFPPYVTSAWASGSHLRAERRTRTKMRSKRGIAQRDRTPDRILATIVPNRKRRKARR